MKLKKYKIELSMGGTKQKTFVMASCEDNARAKFTNLDIKVELVK